MPRLVLVEYLQRSAQWSSQSAANAIVSALIVLVLGVVIGYLRRPALLDIPGPFWAKVTDLWLVRAAMGGHKFEIVHEAHEKYGKFVRIAPNHVSIADHKALQSVYGHSTGTLKSELYDAFAAPGFPRGLFNTRSRAEHTRKRKIVSHTFAPKSINAFEPFIRREVQLLVARFQEFIKAAKEKGSKDHELDMLMWMNFFAFDTIGSLAFGSVFGMLEQGRDDAEVTFERPDGTVVTDTVPAVKIINERGEYSHAMGCVPLWLRPIFKQLPWFANRLKSVKKLSGIALSRVNYRLQHGSDRDDLLAKLQSGVDENGEPMGKLELTAEALTQLIAGSDTTSNTATAIVYHLCTHPDAKKKLQEELDAHLTSGEEVPVVPDVAELPYLNAVINESLRYHSTSAMGLPRLIPEGGAHISGRFFPGGTTVSVPSYTIHRDPEVWGQDVLEYKPERWLNENIQEKFDMTLNPFSIGPRSCIGRHVALIELQVLIATMFKNFDFKLVHPNAPLDTLEGFLRKPTTLPTYISAR
ncbi:unnamed protein product [Sympodiomycopsis kandeliae]